MSDTLIRPSFLFRFAVPCRRLDPLWSTNEIELAARYHIPSFAELDGQPNFADLRVGWHADGLAFSLRVQGKKQSTWCRESRIDESDGLTILVDTRDTHNIHRASRFCHRFIFLPHGADRRGTAPVSRLVPIHLARANPKSVPTGGLRVRSEKRIDGYVMRAVISAAALSGYDPEEHPRLGFSYGVMDRELGWQTLAIDPEMPFQSDPSLWSTLELVE